MGEKCHWAHGPEDLDTRAFNFDFPMANKDHREGGWDRVGSKKPPSVRTSRQNGGQSNGYGARSNNQHNRYTAIILACC